LIHRPVDSRAPDGTILWMTPGILPHIAMSTWG
jgi:hypothetical protein